MVQWVRRFSFIQCTILPVTTAPLGSFSMSNFLICPKVLTLLFKYFFFCLVTTNSLHKNMLAMQPQNCFFMSCYRKLRKKSWLGLVENRERKNTINQQLKETHEFVVGQSYVNTVHQSHGDNRTGTTFFFISKNLFLIFGTR
jgi:hypothetical protein